MLNRLIVFTCSVLLAGLLAGVASSPASARAVSDEMGETRAGKTYEAAICPAYAAYDRFREGVWRGRPRISWDEIRRRLPEIRRLSAAVGRGYSSAARKLYNPTAGEWPADVAPQVRKVAYRSAQKGRSYRYASESQTAREWGSHYRQANRVGATSKLDAQIRAILNLPAEC